MSRTQGSVALSSAESELYALCSAASEALFLRNVMQEARLGAKSILINLWTDSSSAKSLVARGGPGKKSKHIELKYLFLQELVQDAQIKVLKVGTHDNPADLMTKYLSGEVTRNHSYKLGCHPSGSTHDLNMIRFTAESSDRKAELSVKKRY